MTEPSWLERRLGVTKERKEQIQKRKRDIKPLNVSEDILGDVFYDKPKSIIGGILRGSGNMANQMQSRTKSRQERYTELVGTGEQNELGVVKKGKYTPAEAIALLDREDRVQRPEFEQRGEHTPQHQMRSKYPQERKPKERTFWDKLVNATSNVHQNIERESFGMGGGMDFSGGFGGVDLMAASGFGAPRQERKYHPKKHKKTHKTKSSGKSITINL